MATPLLPDTELPLIRGYYVSDNQDLLKDFILRTIHYHEATRVQIHCTAHVRFGQDVHTLHSQNHQHRLLDIAMPDLELHLEEMFGFVDDPDTFFNAGSGGQLLAISNYWALLIKTRHGGDAHDRDEQQAEQEDDPEPENFEDIDPFVWLFAKTQVPTNFITINGERRRMPRARYLESVNNFIMEHNLIPFNAKTRINPSTIAKWHAGINTYNIAVWSKRGINLYQRQFDEDARWFHFMYSDTRRWSHIRSIRIFLRGLPNQHYCPTCSRMHRDVCPNELITNPPLTEKVMPNEHIPQTKHSFVMYADFEACQDRLTGIHLLSGFCLISINNRRVYNVASYSGINAEEEFFNEVERQITQYQLDGINGDAVLNDRMCCKCKKWNGALEGPYRSYLDSTKLVFAHKNCWESLRAEQALIYFHNFRGYDSHHLLRELIHRYPETHYLAKSMEKIDSAAFYSNDIKAEFKDTFNYFSTSLASLASTIKDWHFTPVEHRNAAKNYFPMYWFDDLNKLNEPVPTQQEAWQDMLGNNFVDVQVIQDLIVRHNFHYFKEWHDWYCAKDVWILVEVFEQFRQICFTEEKIDPVYFLGAPSLTWYLAVRSCHKNMHTINNVELYKLIQSQIRGGVSQACERHAEAVETEFRKQEFMYLDVNALYSWCMTQKLPTKLVQTLDELPPNWDTDEDHQYLIYADFTSQKPPHDSEQYDMYRDLPPMPHKWQQRLCTTLLDKPDYLVSSVVLPFWLQHGIRIKKVHRVFKFECTHVLRDYVQNNIAKRKQYPKSDPRNNFYKLLNNSLYGKTCENKFKYRRFVSYRLQDEEDEEDMLNNIDIPVKKIMYLTGDEVFIETTMNRVNLDKPIHLGFTILEWAKLRLFEFWYAIKAHFKKDVSLMYTDTDSLLMKFWVPQDVNIVEEMANEPSIERLLDLHTPVYESDPERNQTAGFFSDELAANEKITEVIALRAKCYAFTKVKNEHLSLTIKNKGITKAAVIENTQDKITMEHYRRVLEDSIQIRVDQYIIRSKDHVIRTVKQNKLALTALDYKRSVCADGIKTKPWDDYSLTSSDIDVFDQ